MLPHMIPILVGVFAFMAVMLALGVSTYGRNNFGQTSQFPTRVTADGFPEWKTGGITLDLATVPAGPTEDVTLPDGSVIKANSGKYLRYGQVVCKITASGKYGPYDSSANDGRELLTPGECFVLDMSWFENAASVDLPGLGGSIHPAVFEGGRVYFGRLLLTDGTTGNTDPAEDDFLTAFPRMSYVRE